MRRVTEVIDCWYDSGAMPFAQWGYRGESPSRPSPPRERAAERFHEQFPADFISEAIDQTRGWFYSQLAISTLLFGDWGLGARELREKTNSPAPSPPPPVPYPHPFRNCIVLGLMLGEDGQKMSQEQAELSRADGDLRPLRGRRTAVVLLRQPAAVDGIRYSEQAIKDSIPEFLLRLWNVYSFFVIYANIDGFDPAEEGCRMRDAGVRNSMPALFADGEVVSPCMRARASWIAGS